MLDIVKEDPRMPPPVSNGRYHHGDLRTVVKKAALQVLATQGPAALSLRQVAAQAGVSHTAPRHHFGDKQRLLTELAIDGFTTLEAAMATAIDSADSPRDQLTALLAAYVAHHRDHPGYAAIMWRTDLIDGGDRDLARVSLRTFEHLHTFAATAGGPLAQSLGPYRLSLMLWSLAHGVAGLADRLTPDLAIAVGDADDSLPAPEDLIREFARAALRAPGEESRD
jgi:AcrR family transcriptional regulator